MDDDDRIAKWEAWKKSQSEAGFCPYSGMTIRMCKHTDICDCFDFPEYDYPIQTAMFDERPKYDRG